MRNVHLSVNYGRIAGKDPLGLLQLGKFSMRWHRYGTPALNPFIAQSCRMGVTGSSLMLQEVCMRHGGSKAATLGLSSISRASKIGQHDWVHQNSAQSQLLILLLSQSCNGMSEHDLPEYLTDSDKGRSEDATNMSRLFALYRYEGTI